MSKATTPWPRPSCSMVESIRATMLIAMIVSVSSFEAAVEFRMPNPSSATAHAGASEECHTRGMTIAITSVRLVKPYCGSSSSRMT